MADGIPLEVKLEGVAADTHYGWAGGDLYLPIAAPEDIATRYVEPTVDKLGNDATHDIYTNLTDWKIFDDLSGGFGQKFADAGGNKYFEPTFTNGTAGALAWTLDPDAPLLPGAYVKSMSASGYAFSDFVSFKGAEFALDTKNWRVWRRDSGTDTWQYYAGAGTGWTSTVLGGTITGAANDGGGEIRITSNAHGLLNGDIVTIRGVLGTTEANSTSAAPTWVVKDKTANTFDLTGSVFVNAYVSGGTYKADAAGLLSEPTELIVILGVLYVGQPTAYGRRSSNPDTASPTWTNFQAYHGVVANAQHYALVNKHVYYSNSNGSSNNGVFNATTNSSWSVGDIDTYVQRMVWFSDYLVITKPEGVWVLLPAQNSLQRLTYNKARHADNGRALVTHQGNVYWNIEDDLYKWDGFSDPPQKIAKWDGNDNRIFYQGRIRALHSDGHNLYLIYRVITSDASPYRNDFVLIMNSETFGYHPVYVSSSTTADPSYFVGGVMLDNNKLYFSCGTTAPASVGYLLTDGRVPLSDTNKPYTWGVGIKTPYLDFARGHLKKWFQKAIVNTRDISATNTGYLNVAYQRWGDASKTEFGTNITGTNENLDVTPAAAIEAVGTDAAFQLQAGFSAVLVRFWLTLNNSGSSAQKEKMFYVKSLHMAGMIAYPFAREDAINVRLDFTQTIRNNTNKRGYVGATVLAGLLAAQNQRIPMKATFPDGSTAYVTVLPSGAGRRVTNYGTDGKPEHEIFGIILKEMR